MGAGVGRGAGMLLGSPEGLAAVLCRPAALYKGRPPGRVLAVTMPPGAAGMGGRLGLLGRGCIMLVGA